MLHDAQYHSYIIINWFMKSSAKGRDVTCK